MGVLTFRMLTKPMVEFEKRAIDELCERVVFTMGVGQNGKIILMYFFVH
jgi:hypothetical protein